jgi:oligopeptide transport system substrate-binding protein
MFKTTKSIVQLVILTATCLVISACTNSCSQKTSSSDTTLHFPLTSTIKGLDPIQSNSTYSSRVVSQIFTPLFQYHYLKRPFELEPLAAESMPEASEDGLVHTIKIKRGMKFHDNDAFPNGEGREVKAQDFIYSWKRLADPDNRANGFWIFDGKIKGLNEWRDAKSAGSADYDTEIEGMKALDDYTLQITLIKPYYQLYYTLAMEFTSVVPKEAVEEYGEEFLNNPVGSGPYVFTEWVRGSKITLDKNPNYFAEKYPSEGAEGDEQVGLLADAGKNLPFNDKIIFYEVVESQPLWLNFMKGNYDISAIPKDNFDSTIVEGDLSPEMKKKGIQMSTYLQPDVTYIAFNMKDPVLGKNDKLRKAIAMAYDSATSIEKFYNGRGVKAHSPIAPGIDAYDPEFKNPYVEFDQSKAKKMLEDAGFPEGKGAPTLEYATTASSTARQMAEYFKQNMEAIGLKIEIASVSWPQLQAKIKDAKAQMWGIAWLADYPDAENFLQLLYGPNGSPGPNGANFNNSEFNKLYEQASALPPGPERTEVYRKMRDIFVKEMPWVPNVHRKGYSLRHGWIKNYKPNPMKANSLKYFKVDAAKRAELKAKL